MKDFKIKVPSEKEFEIMSLKNYARSILNETDFINWYDKIAKIVITPKTEYFVLSYELMQKIYKVAFDGEKIDLKNDFANILEKIDAWVSTNTKYPIFIKSGLFSGKHTYNDCCVANNKDEILQKFLNIILNQELVGCEGSSTIVIRELLDITHSKFTAFDGMPVVREFRFFIKDNKLESYQEYWIKEAIENHTEYSECGKELDIMNKLTDSELAFLKNETSKIMKVLQGDWSVDWLQDKNGEWYCIDLAEYHKSFKKENRIYLETNNKDKNDR